MPKAKPQITKMPMNWSFNYKPIDLEFLDANVGTAQVLESIDFSTEINVKNVNDKVKYQIVQDIKDAMDLIKAKYE